MTPQARAPRGNGLAERRLTAEHVIARALVEAATFSEAVPRILEAICGALDWEHGALWEIDRQAEVLRCVQIWTAASLDFPKFNAASKASTFARGMGCLAGLGQRRAVVDSRRGPGRQLPRAPVAVREGLHGALGFPILLRGDVVGVMSSSAVKFAHQARICSRCSPASAIRSACS